MLGVSQRDAQLDGAADGASRRRGPPTLGDFVSLANGCAHRRRTAPHVLTPKRWSAVAATALLAGCFTIPQYPASLPALANADTTIEVCPPIAGAFLDAGTATAPDGRNLGSVSLTRLLHSRDNEIDGADVVLVKGPEGDVVEIESFLGQRRLGTWRQSKVSKEAYLAKGDRVVAETYLCQDGFVRLGRQYSVGGGGSPGLVVLGVKSDFLWLRKATDGSLIALHTNYDYVAINLILPVGNADKLWYRFLPAVPPLPRAPDESLQGTREEAARP